MFAYWNFINYANCESQPEKPNATCVRVVGLEKMAWNDAKKSEGHVIKIVNIVAS